MTCMEIMQEDVSTASWTLRVEKYHNSCTFKINIYRTMKMEMPLEDFIVEGEVLEGDKSLFYAFFNTIKNELY